MGKTGVSLTNAVGVIDSDYRGELKLCLTYIKGTGGHFIKQGDRVAQLVVLPALTFELTEVDVLTPTERGAGAFGSTGK